MTNPVPLRESHSTQQAASGLASAVEMWLRQTDPTAIWQSCLTCHRLADDGKTCREFNAAIPVKIAVRGCDKYSDHEGVPF